MTVTTLDRLQGAGSQKAVSLFRRACRPSDRLIVYRAFRLGFEQQIPKFDSDETLELVLRFPGLPDAIAGHIRGMQSYDHWLYYRLDPDGGKFGFHYARGQSAIFVEDYLRLLEEVLGRSVEVQYAEDTLETLSMDNWVPKVETSMAVQAPYTLSGTHSLIKAVIFDLDNTLASTDHLRTFRETRDRAGLVAALEQAPLEVHEDLRRVLKEVSAHVPIALVTLSPAWYAEQLQRTLFPDVEWASVVTYADVERHKPYPDAFRLAAQQMGVPAAEVLVVGDNWGDVEAAYHTGMHMALATWHVEDTDALEFIPDAVLKHPEDLLWYLTSPAFGRPFLEAWLMDEDWEALDYGEPFPAWTDVPGEPPLPVGVLGRYFPRYDQTLHLHDAHLLSQQIIAKERPEPFQMPQSWSWPLGSMLASQDVDIVTVVPAKPGKDQRLERMLKELKIEAAVTVLPDLLAFEEGTPDVKRLPAAERYPTIRRHLRVQGDCRGKRVLVFDDVLTQGATLQAATDRLLEAGAVEVKRLAIARTIGPDLFEVSDETRTCPSCGALLKRLKRRSDGVYFWGCSAFSKTGCRYTEDAN